MNQSTKMKLKPSHTSDLFVAIPSSVMNWIQSYEDQPNFRHVNEITKAVVWLSLICTNPSLLLTEAFIRKVNHPVIILARTDKNTDIKCKGSLIQQRDEILTIPPNCQNQHNHNLTDLQC